MPADTPERPDTADTADAADPQPGGFMDLADGTKIQVDVIIDPEPGPDGSVVVWLQPRRRLTEAERGQLAVANIVVTIPDDRLGDGQTQVTLRFGSPGDWTNDGGTPLVGVESLTLGTSVGPVTISEVPPHLRQPERGDDE